MKRTTITVTDAARNFADCVNRAHYQNVTFVLLKNGTPFARLVPDNEKVCLGSDLAEILAKAELPDEEARAWHRDLPAARATLKAGSGQMAINPRCLRNGQSVAATVPRAHSLKRSAPPAAL